MQTPGVRFLERKPLAAIALAFTCLLAIPPSSGQAPADSALRTAVEDDIREVVLRKQMKDWLASDETGERKGNVNNSRQRLLEPDCRLFVVSIDGKGSSDALLNRLRDMPRKVASESDAAPCKWSEEQMLAKTVNDPDRVTFSVENIRWLSKREVILHGGYFCGLQCAADYTFRLKLKNGQWKIVSQKPNWFS